MALAGVGNYTLRSMKARFGAALLLAALGCGAPPSILLEIELRGLGVPSDVDALELRVDAAERAPSRRRFALAAGDVAPSLLMVQGEDTPDWLVLTAMALRGETLVAQSAPRSMRFGSDEPADERVVICRDYCP